MCCQPGHRGKMRRSRGISASVFNIDSVSRQFINSKRPVMTLQSLRSCIHTTLILLLLPAMGNISSAQSSTAAQLLDAAQRTTLPP